MAGLNQLYDPDIAHVFLHPNHLQSLIGFTRRRKACGGDLS